MIPIARPTIGIEELKNVKKVFDSAWLGMGSFVYEFEKKIQDYIGVKHAVCVSTGTAAIHLALAALGVKRGDEIIVPSLTFAGSVQPILMCGATPVFCEVSEDTLNMDVRDMEKRITGKTKAIIPVHYGGLSCDMDSILGIARKRGIKIVEDAAHAFGSTHKGRKIGSFGDVTCFSFDPIKNLTCGEGGCVTVNNAGLAAALRRKRLLGIDRDTWMRYKNKRSWFYEVVTEGYRYHMSNVNAAIGLAQFNMLEKFIEKKRRIVKDYDRFFGSIDGIKLLTRDYEESAPFNYTIRIPKAGKKIVRDNFIQYMKKNGISVGVNYIPNHTQPVFMRYSSRLSITEGLWSEIVSLPLYYDMTEEEISKVKNHVRKFMEAKKR